jgi:Tol biopolymer transport system component
VTAVPSTASAATVGDGVIAYVRAANVAGGYLIRSVDPSTRADRWLAQGTSPAWSPNGRRLAFIRLSDSGVGAIRIRNADGSVTATGVPAQPRDEHTRDLAWSPDGTRLAYGYQGRIWVMNVAKPYRPRAVSPHEGYAPAWSPDSRRILYSSDEGGGTPDLHRVRADGTGHVNVTNTPSDSEFFADWSLDGTRIAWFSDSGEVGLYISDPDGSDPNIVASTFRDHSPSWSPTGGRIAIIGDPGDLCWQVPFQPTQGGCAPEGPSPVLQLDWQPRIVN